MTVSVFGRLRLTMLRLWRRAYSVSTRGTLTPVSWDNLRGEPK
jgi:hypothetical protein